MFWTILLISIPVIVAYGYNIGLEIFLAKYRWVFVCFLLMPVSVIFELFLSIRNKIAFQLKSAPPLHNQRVSKIQEAVKQWNRTGRKSYMCTGRQGWLTMSLRVGKYKYQNTRIDLDLYDILKIDTVRQTVLLEPQVTMGQLTASLVPIGWTIPVLPELDDLTVGGLIMGCGIETSSHKYGLFQHTCISFEIILASGELVHCSRDESSDLFYGIPWSHGTIGFLVAAEIRIIPAKKYVRLLYEPIFQMDDMIKKYEEYSNQVEENEFVECLAFSKDDFVIMRGAMVDSAVHSQDILPFGNNPVFRVFFGWTMPPKISLLKLTSPQAILDLYETKHIVQDMVVPISSLQASLNYFHEHTELYPLWLCPARLENVKGLVHPKGKIAELYVDIGAYGTPKSPCYAGPITVEKIEHFVIQNNGFQLLYADSYLSRENFRRMFDHNLHDELRKKYGCEEAFFDIYDKVSRKARR